MVSILVSCSAKFFVLPAKDLANSFLVITLWGERGTFVLNSTSKNIKNLSPGPKSHLLSCFPFLQVLLLRIGHLSSHMKYLANYNQLHIFSYTVWILNSHTAAKISSVEICQVGFQGPKQRHLVPSETPKYLRSHLYQTVTYDVKPWGNLHCPGLAAGCLAKFPRTTKVILYNPALPMHKCL